MHLLAALLVAQSARTRIEQGDCPTEPPQHRETLEEALCELQKAFASDLAELEFVRIKAERDSLQRRVEELTEAVRFGTELLRGHRYNWEHEQGDEDAPHTGEDCRACEYEALLARFEAALASDSKEGR